MSERGFPQSSVVKKRNRVPSYISSSVHRYPNKKRKLSHNKLKLPKSFQKYPQYELINTLQEKINTHDNYIRNENQFIQDLQNDKIQLNDNVVMPMVIGMNVENLRRVPGKKNEFVFDIYVLGRVKSKNSSFFRFSRFVRSITIEYHESCGIKDAMTLNANKMNEKGGFKDGIRFMNQKYVGKLRKLQLKCTIQMAYDPALCTMDEELKEFLDGTELQHGLQMEGSNCVKKILNFFVNYCEIKSLLKPNEKNIVLCDESLSNLFDTKVFDISSLLNLLQPHLNPPDDIIIDYSFRLKKMGSQPIKEVEFTFHTKNFLNYFDFIHDENVDSEVVDKEIDILIEELKNREEKRNFFLGFAENPVKFSYEIMCSQTRDINAIRENDFEGKGFEFSNYWEQKDKNKNSFNLFRK